MPRVRIIKSQRGYRQGDIVEVSKNVAFGLIDSGVGVISKDMTEQDYKVNTLDEEQANANKRRIRRSQ